ncbi:hypothetical protein [Alicyclobacillus hesperidum]|uniref:Uncharacterized protein n=1 Tax=Alicyclobacillus hesperidum TaxID=89784 RepID=A0A1H2Q447_9BACL|nr:hypothetical protein [Alicyclobacillus hesperidum]SDW01578.1 hypothetical protein SAMN04489725_10156 [Alicyclobacillus hesperidum]
MQTAGEVRALTTRRQAHKRRRIANTCAYTLAVLFPVIWSVAAPAVVRADTPSLTDFGQRDVPLHAQRHLHSALFVTESDEGTVAWEEHGVRDDAIVAFVAEHPAWRLNVPLSWYFMEPVYERHAAQDGEQRELAI